MEGNPRKSQATIKWKNKRNPNGKHVNNDDKETKETHEIY